MMQQFGKRLDELLILRPDPPNTATGRVFRPTHQSFRYELVG